MHILKRVRTVVQVVGADAIAGLGLVAEGLAAVQGLGKHQVLPAFEHSYSCALKRQPETETETETETDRNRDEERDRETERQRECV